jgi:hypothetical protein
MRAAVGPILEERGRLELDGAEGRRQFDLNVFGLARMTQLGAAGQQRGRSLRSPCLGDGSRPGIH